MRKSAGIPVVSILLVLLLGSTAFACVGVPDLDRSIIRQAFEGLATLLVIPDGSGPPVTEALTGDGTVVDATIHVTIIGNCNGDDPVANFPFEDMWLESIGGGLVPCQGGATADSNTDVEGHTQWSLPLRAGGYDEGNCRVVVNGVWMGNAAGLTLNFNSPDMNGDREINLSDVGQFSVDYFGPYEFRADFIHDGVVNLSDLSALAGSVGKSCP